MTLKQKVEALAAIQSGRGTIASLMGTVWEFLTASDKEPDIFINEVTGQSLTASKLKERGYARPYLKFFVTQLWHKDNEPII